MLSPHWVSCSGSLVPLPCSQHMFSEVLCHSHLPLALLLPSNLSSPALLIQNPGTSLLNFLLPE